MAGVVVTLELPTGVLADRIGRKRTYLMAVAFQAAAYGSLLFARGFLCFHQVEPGFGRLPGGRAGLGYLVLRSGNVLATSGCRSRRDGGDGQPEWIFICGLLSCCPCR